MPGAIKLDHLQPIEPILFKKIVNFFTFILGGQFLLPQRANNEKGEFAPRISSCYDTFFRFRCNAEIA